MFERDTDRKENKGESPRTSIQFRSLSGLVLLVLMPLFYAVMLSATFAVLNQLLLGKSFGLSAQRDAPWPGDFGLVFLAAFWVATIVDRLPLAPRLSQGLLVLGWVATFLAWSQLEPVYDGNALLTHPGALVNEDGYLVPPLIVSLLIWWVGMSIARDLPFTSPEEFRGMAQRNWIILGISILMAVTVDGEAGDKALSASRFAVPALAIASLALIAGGEVQTTRRLAIRRGGQPPDWNRWLRLVSGMSAVVVALTTVVLIILSPHVVSLLLGIIGWIARMIGWGIRYLFLALIFVIFQIVLGITWLIEQLFGDVIGPIEMPEQELLPQQSGQSPFPIRENTSEVPYATELRWLLLIVAILIIGFVVFRIARKYMASPMEDALDEQRESVFSADLARRQLRDLFRRKPKPEPVPALNLEVPPRSVRESMLYLQTLADRQPPPRLDLDTAEDFAGKLRAAWPGLGQPITDLTRRYERVRYGDESRDTDPAEIEATSADWQQIWNARKDVPRPDPSDKPA